MKPKILVVSNTTYSHIKKFDANLSLVNNDEIEVEFFHLGYSGANLTYRVHCITKHFPEICYRFDMLAKIFLYADLVLTFATLKKYNLINIHFLTIHSFFLLLLYKFKGEKLMISPWGSDVYRAKGFKRLLLGFVYDFADYVSAPEIRFRSDIVRIFKVPATKIVDACFGSHMVDFIMNRKNVTKSNSKENIGYKDHLVIACGYNKGIFQNHAIIIDALVTNKNLLSPNTVLLFLLTYGREYDLSPHLKKLDDNELKYHLYTEFLDDEKLFNIQNASDIFIHIQDSDANSAFMQEFLLCDAVVVNGSWLPYEHLQKEVNPFVLVPEKNVDSLNGVLKKVLDPNFVRPLTLSAKAIVRSFAWSHQIKKWHSFYRQQVTKKNDYDNGQNL